MGIESRGKKLEVFLSHLTVEAAFADALKRHLVQDFIGLVNVFVASDTTSVPVGSQWLTVLLAALHRAELQLILCSKDSLKRPWIHYEAGAARMRGIPTVPLCHSGLAPAQLPVPLSESEGIELTTADGLRRLYETIAGLLGSGVPAVDFGEYGRQFRGLEETYESQRPREGVTRRDTPSIERIPKPRVVCVTSEQFREIGFENQLQLVLDAFPSNVTHDIVKSSADVTRVLGSGRVDILHIAAYVCPRGGSVYFSDVDLPSGNSLVTEDKIDKIYPEALVKLLTASKTSLVVVGSCESLALATILLPATDVIAANDMVSAKSMASWVETFYNELRTKPLADAYELATAVSRAPMKLYARQTELPKRLFGDQAKDTDPPSQTV